jgi:hypothetical protein
VVAVLIKFEIRNQKFELLGARGALVAPCVATVAAPAISGATVAATAAAAFATVTAAAATTTAATAEVIAAATAAAEAALIARARFVDAEGASLDLLAVKLGDGVLSVCLGGHGDEGESAGFAREFILHEQDFGDGAGLRKHVLQLEFRCRERQVAYVQSISHNGLDFRSRRLTVSRGKYVAEETPMTDPAEPDVFLCCSWHEEYDKKTQANQ